MPNPLDPLDGMWRTRRPRPVINPAKPASRPPWLYTLAGVGVTLVVVALAFGLVAVATHVPRPTPIPTPTPPAPVGELRVILVQDSAANMSRGQLDALNSTKVRDWLDKHCGKDTDGRPAWRRWDKDVGTANESDVWRKVWDAAKPKLGALPQVVILRGQKGDALPLPDTEQGLLDLLAKHGGK
jgi:hypothetical protein